MKEIADKGWAKYGPWAFYVGLLVALILAFVDIGEWALWLLAILGIIVGLLNVREKETNNFLLASLAWIVAGNFLSGALAPLMVIGLWLSSFLSNVVVFVGPAAAVVAIMALWRLAKD